MTEQNNPQPRIFKIGTTTIQADDSMANLDNEQVRAILKRTYPEVAHANIRETTLENGTQVIHYIPVAGRKG
nr:PRTRC system protein C [Nitrosomonas nitrosa]